MSLRRLHWAATAVLLGCILLTGCTRGAVESEPEFDTHSCHKDTEAVCTTLGGVEVFLPTGELDLASPVIVADLGGPGQDPLAQPTTGEVLAGAGNIAVPLEPWVLNPPDEKCHVALSAYVTAVREKVGQLPSRARDFADTCSGALEAERDHLDTGLSTVGSHLGDLGVPRVVWLGMSFGAERVARAANDGDAAVLVGPWVAAPDLGAELGRRKRETLRALELTEEQTTQLAEVRRMLPTELPRRSVPFTTRDLDAALVAASYSPAQSGPEFKRDLATMHDALSRRSAVSGVSWMPTAADQVEGRYAVRDHYRGLIGYFGGYCSTTSGLPSAAEGDFLTDFHSVCASLPKSKKAQDTSLAGCAIMSSLDPVAAPLSRVRDRFPGIETIDMGTVGHSAGNITSQWMDLATRFTTEPNGSCRLGQ